MSETRICDYNFCWFSVFWNENSVWFANASCIHHDHIESVVHVFLHGPKVSLTNDGSKWWHLWSGMVLLFTQNSAICAAHDTAGATTILSQCIWHYHVEFGELRWCELNDRRHEYSKLIKQIWHFPVAQMGLLSIHVINKYGLSWLNWMKRHDVSKEQGVFVQQEY